MPQFTPHQDNALKSVADWLKAGPGRNGTRQVFRLFGYAGTGKTTLARHIAEDTDGDVKFAAFTGKAASVMRGKGCRGASTIHSLIYRARESGEEIPNFDLWDEAPASKAELIIIDECSMVDAELGRDLLSFGVPVLVLGDPAQLPPIRMPCSPRCTDRPRTTRSCGCRWISVRANISSPAATARPKSCGKPISIAIAFSRPTRSWSDAMRHAVPTMRACASGADSRAKCRRPATSWSACATTARR